MHVLKITRIGKRVYGYCECGRTLAILGDWHSQDDVDRMVNGHRQHALFEANVLEVVLREGSTTQRHAPIDPLAEPDLKPALTSGAQRPD